ncbi:MAG TPA: GIY-YIG nuclease family protein [Ruminococcus flavefaciens]|nr:GIY-YIG nuclease family protein [Ruminococcus flavefaciens]HQM02351.1 GIY-YIG nuclease family protein [Ruminococcus flavefaciens]
MIFENGTESNNYLRTLSSQLYNDDGFIVVNSETNEEDNKKAVGYIYILKSKSEDTSIQDIKDLYKIGMTEDTVENRIANAEKDPTYLMAPVEIVETYKVTGDYNTQKVEALIHRFFADAKVVLAITDKDGKEYTPDEWYSVPIGVIREAIDMLNTGDIVNFIYDNEKQKIIEL